MLRGNGDAGIFFDNDHRQYFLDLVEEGIRRFRHRIHAFCLMACP